MKATITLEYDDSETAEAVSKAVSPDNFKTPSGLKVETRQCDTTVVTEISLEGMISTFIATIDDLLGSASTAEKSLQVIKEKQF